MRITGTLSLAAAVLLVGCRDTSAPTSDASKKIANAQEKIGAAAEATAEAVKAKRDEYVHAMSRQLDELNTKYEALKDRAAKADNQAKMGLETKLSKRGSSEMRWPRNLSN